jgi:hypothetical protein
MSHSENDVLVCPSSGSEREFSGFEREDFPEKENDSPKKGRVKSVIVKPDRNSKKGKKLKNTTQKNKSVNSKSKDKVTNPGKNLIDLNNMSADDIEILRTKLGIAQSFTHSLDDDPDEHVDLNNAPNMHIQLQPDSNDSDDDDSIGIRRPSKPKDMTKRLINSLFGDDENMSSSDENDVWALPKIRAKSKGEAISSSLAKAVNVACTSQCETDSLCERHCVPENCEMLNSPIVNNEVWKAMDKKARSYDRLFQEIQGLLASGLVPVLKLVKILKPAIMANQDAKQYISDAITLLGQVQFNLSVRRRYLIRPSLNKKYRNLCGINTPITTSLFGDDVSKEIKTCETGLNLGKEKNFFQPYGRSSFRGRYPRSNVYKGRGRSSPYGMSQSNYRGGYNSTRGFSRKGPKPQATVTAPNEGN